MKLSVLAIGVVLFVGACGQTPVYNMDGIEITEGNQVLNCNSRNTVKFNYADDLGHTVMNARAEWQQFVGGSTYQNLNANTTRVWVGSAPGRFMFERPSDDNFAQRGDFTAHVNVWNNSNPPFIGGIGGCQEWIGSAAGGTLTWGGVIQGVQTTVGLNSFQVLRADPSVGRWYFLGTTTNVNGKWHVTLDGPNNPPGMGIGMTN